MLKTYAIRNNVLQKTENLPGEIPEDAVWIDMLEPTREEESMVEAEIELSNRFYEEDDALFMTAAVLAKSDTEEADAHEITFVLVNSRLVTLRYVEPQSFKNFSLRGQKISTKGNTAESLLAGLLGAIINRMADIVEKVDRQIDTVSSQIFKSNFKKGRNSTQHFQRIIKELGLAGELISKTQESLVSINRLVTFLLPNLSLHARKAVEPRLNYVSRDVNALREHAGYLIDKINFLLDATLGLINIQQNDIMKIFSIAAVCFMPGTLITGFFGMNFERLPMLHWHWGYEFSIAAIVASIIIPFLLFRRKGWL